MDATTAPPDARETEEPRDLEPMEGEFQPGEDIINGLPDDVLSAILERAFSSKAMHHALVCRWWLRLAQHLQQAVHVSAERNLHAGELLRGLASFPNVTSLTLAYRSVDFLNDEFLTAMPSACPQLSCLCLDEPRYTGVPHFRITPQCLGRFLLGASRLEELTLDHSLGNMTKLPSSLASLLSLRVLNLSMPRLTVLPKEFGALPALEELRLPSQLLKVVS
ncbi:unnamed protein product [Closterium sp. Naga37s-1]|nr:unnamed protein product [Closterium sp. Naga37s-1]